MKTDKKFLYLGAMAVLAIALSIAGVSPLFLLILACPVMMLFMMNGMGHGMNHDKDHEHK